MDKKKATRGPFLQPLAVGSVCLIFVVLLLTMSTMDYRTLEKTLSDYMEKRGSAFVSIFQRAVTYHFQLMDHVERVQVPPIPGTGNDPVSFQETLVMSLLALGQQIDHEGETEGLSQSGIRDVARKEGLWLVAFFDDEGQLILENRPVPGKIRKAVSSMVKHRIALDVQLLDDFKHKKAYRFMALKRKGNRGFLVLALDHAAFDFWKMRTAVVTAAEEVGIPADISCFSVKDFTGRVFFQSGNCPDFPEEKVLFQNRTSDAVPVSSQKMKWQGQNQFIMTTPFFYGNDHSGVLRLGFKTDTLDHIIVSERIRGLVAVTSMGIMAVLAMGFLYRNQNRHLRKLREMETQLHRAERMAAMGRLAEAVAHEIRNPLNAIHMACQRLKKDNLDQLSGIIRQEIGRLNQIVEEFLGLSRGRRLKPGRQDVVMLVEQVEMVMSEDAASRGVRIRKDLRVGEFMLTVDGDKIKQALINLIKNAFESMEKGGEVTVTVKTSGEKTLQISVSDTGKGLLPADLEKIFDPDFTTKERGMGLGLALVHEIVQAHGGEVRVSSQQGVGSNFEMILPGDFG